MQTVSWWRTTFGEPEIQGLTAAIHHEHISQGPVTAEFEARIAEALGVPYAVATTSGSMAILMALMALGVRRGDEVIVPNRTWIATAHAVAMLGANVVLVDVKPDVPIMDVSLVRSKITPRTKAIIPVHLGGRIVEMRELQAIAEEHDLLLIEDASQALFSRNAEGFAGTHSDAGCFSLSVAKLISTGQGGFVVTKSKQVYEELKLIRTHGVTDVINATYTHLGFNFRFTDLLASVGIAQLARAPQRIAHAQAIYAKYETGTAQLPFLKLIPTAVAQGEVPLYIEVLCDNRASLIEHLAAKGVQTRPFYPDLNLATHLGNSGEFPNSRVFGEHGLFLPSGPEQPLVNVDHVLDVLRLYPSRAHRNLRMFQ
jgi:perosamine synthetase